MSHADSRCMPSHTISLSMMQFEPGPLMAVEPGESSRSEIVCDNSPAEMDMMLSLIVEPEPIRIDDFRQREPERRAG